MLRLGIFSAINTNSQTASDDPPLRTDGLVGLRQSIGAVAGDKYRRWPRRKKIAEARTACVNERLQGHAVQPGAAVHAEPGQHHPNAVANRGWLWIGERFRPV